MSPNRPTIDRRSVLKWTSGAAAALTVGTGSASAQQGGSGVVAEETWENHSDERFKITERRDTFDFACRGNNEDKTWRCYGIEFESHSHDHNLYVNPNRRLDTGDWHEFTGNGLTCKHNNRDGSIVKVSFKPVDKGNGGRGRGSGR